MNCYIIVTANENGVDFVVKETQWSAIEDRFCKEFIEKICEYREDVVNEYLKINRDNNAIVIDRSVDDFYSLIRVNNLIGAFLEFCANTEGIKVETSTAKIKTPSGFYEISYYIL